MKETIAIIGGTGNEGKGLAYRWSRAGYKIIIGSRKLEKAQIASAEIKSLVGEDYIIEGKVNTEAATNGDIVVLTVPFHAHREILISIRDYVQGKIFVDVTVPIIPPLVTKVQLPSIGSAAQEAQQLLGSGVYVVSAFQNISYDLLTKDQQVECDVLVCSHSAEAKQKVMQLVSDAGLVGWDAGPLENSCVVEGLTSILIGINKQYGIKNAGIKITGIHR